jgi:uncharacterized protein (DUF2147 family)
MTTTNINYSARTGISMRMIQSVLFLCILLSTSLALSADISGTWKHVKKPIWIEIRLAQGDGIVVRNDKFPERVGNTFVKDLKVDKSEQKLWHGTAYIRKIEDYKDVEISLSETGNMQVTGSIGFLSRTVEWVRIDKVPATQ